MLSGDRKDSPGRIQRQRRGGSQVRNLISSVIFAVLAYIVLAGFILIVFGTGGIVIQLLVFIAACACGGALYRRLQRPFEDGGGAN